MYLCQSVKALEITMFLEMNREEASEYVLIDAIYDVYSLDALDK